MIFLLERRIHVESTSDTYQKVLQFLKQYPKLFSEFERTLILDYAKKGVVRGDFLPDLMREIYDELGLIPDDENVFSGFFDLLQKKFPLEERQVVEVGGGVIPCMGKRISLMQKSGCITVYDPLLSLYEKGNERMKLVRRSFTPSTDVSGVDLIFGFMPCEATEVIIDVATSKEIDFMVALCEGGPHGDEYDYYESDDEWINSMIYFARQQVDAHRMGQLKVKYLSKYNDPYPIIYNQK